MILSIMDISLTTDQEPARVAPEKVEPNLGGLGSNAMIGSCVPPIIAYPEITANGNLIGAEVAMSFDQGYIRLPRSLLEHPMFKDAPCEYQVLYLVMFQHAAIAPYDINDNGKLVRLEVGEICFSIDQLQKMCGKHVSAKQVERGIVYFRKCHFAGQRPGHRRSILKITHSESYDLISRATGTRSGTRPGQDRDINREDKEGKEEKKKTTKKKSAAASAQLAVEKIEKIKVRDAVELTQSQIDTAKAKFGEPLFEAMCDRLNSYKLSNDKTYKSDYGLFVQGTWLVAAAKKILEESSNGPAAPSATPRKSETLGDVLQDFQLGSYYYSAKFGNFELFSKEGSLKFSKALSDLAGIRQSLEKLKLGKPNER